MSAVSITMAAASGNVGADEAEEEPGLDGAHEPAQHVEQDRGHERPSGLLPEEGGEPLVGALEAQRVALEPGAEPAPAEAVEPAVHAVGHPAVRGGEDDAERDAHEDERRSASSSQGRPRWPIAAVESRVEQRPGEERREAEEEAVRDDDEELPRDGGHDAALEGHAAAALEQVGLDRLGHDRARGQAEHQARPP